MPFQDLNDDCLEIILDQLEREHQALLSLSRCCRRLRVPAQKRLVKRVILCISQRPLPRVSQLLLRTLADNVTLAKAVRHLHLTVAADVEYGGSEEAEELIRCLEGLQSLTLNRPAGWIQTTAERSKASFGGEVQLPFVRDCPNRLRSVVFEYRITYSDVLAAMSVPSIRMISTTARSGLLLLESPVAHEKPGTSLVQSLHLTVWLER